MPPQAWKEIKVEVETRPPQVTHGMNEFLVIASVGRRPAHDLIVSVQIMGSGRWQQSIQDGDVGVYRRSLLVKAPESDVLLVRLEHGEQQKVLEFPLGSQYIPGSEESVEGSAANSATSNN